MKKSLSLVMAGLLAVSGVMALAGCGEPTTYEINWDVDLSQPYEIKALYPSTGISDFKTGNTDTAKIIAETTGYSVKYEELSAANGDKDVDNALSDRKQYDIMKLDSAQYTPYLKRGGFLDLTELLEKTESGKKLYELIDLMPNGWDSVKFTDEEGVAHIYGVPDFGYCVMEDSAFVWNVEHLKRIGHVDAQGNPVVPTTLSDFTNTLKKCQEVFGADNTNYHALGIPGANSARLNPIISALDGSIEFDVDDNGNIQLYIYDDAYVNYVEYMSMLKKDKIISDSWQASSANDNCAKFANEQSSCVFTVYWWVAPLVNAIVAQGSIAQKLGIENDYQTVHDDAIAWHTRIRGDGYEWTNHGQTFKAPDQAKAKIHGGDDGVSYYTVIPYYMAENAVYVIDFLAKKLEHFAEYYGGKEGEHWNVIEAPAGAPEFDPENPWGLIPYENMKEKIIFLRPYSYEFQGKTISGGGHWVQLTDCYISQIADNSQYCNGTNSIAANSLFHLRETGFDAWQVTVPMDDTIIKNPMTMMPPLEKWSQVNIASRTFALRGLGSAIDADDATKAINITREALKKDKFKKVDGVKYYFWSDEVSKELTDWFKQAKPGWTNNI